METAIQLINSVGFPIFVAMYLLLRLEPTMKELQKTIAVLAIIIAKCNDIEYADVRRMVGNFSNGDSERGV